MAWFKLDDDFGNHPKIQRAGNAPVGLWVRCATYSARFHLDGKVPIETAYVYGRRAEIDALTEVGLWVPTGDGFLIPDFLEYNPSSTKLDAKRAEDRERKARARNGMTGRFE